MLWRAFIPILLKITAFSMGQGVFAADAGQRAFLTVDDVLRAEPLPSATVVMRLKAGQAVRAGERRGFWRRVEVAAASTGTTGAAGWLRLSTLRLPNARPAPGLAALNTGREAGGNVALVSGARSVAGRGVPISAEALRAAKADESTWSSIATSPMDPATRAQFIAEGGLVKRPLAALAVVSPSGQAVMAGGVSPTALERELAGKIFALARPVSDPALQGYLARVGDVLIDALPEARRKTAVSWRFVLLDTPSIMAFALPEGLVLVSRGLFAELVSEDELAAVLAREMVHVQRRHHWRALRSPALDTYLRPLPAELEFLADEEGMRLAALAGYDSTALIAVLERIDAATAAGRDTSLLRSLLPSVSDRVATLAAAVTPELERAAVPSAAAQRIRRFGTERLGGSEK